MSTIGPAPLKEAPPSTDCGALGPIYHADERVLCLDIPLLYEARILDKQQVAGPAALAGVPEWEYLVHYEGWEQEYVTFSS